MWSGPGVCWLHVPLQKTVYGKTQADVIARLDELKQQAKLNAKSIVSKDSLAIYLQSWLSNDVAVNRAGKTYEEYESAVRLYIAPFVGSVLLSKLDAERLQKWQAKLKRDGFSDNRRLRSIRVLRKSAKCKIQKKGSPHRRNFRSFSKTNAIWLY